MQAQYNKVGKVIDYTNTTSKAIMYNEVVTLGSRIGVAAESIVPGGIGAVQVEGVYLLPAAAEEFIVGDVLYIGEDDKVTKTKGAVIAGWAIEPKASAASMAAVKINDVIMVPAAGV